MEPFNMSQLNSFVQKPMPSDTAATGTSGVNSELKVLSLSEPDEEFHCEYREDIWKSLLEQEAGKHIIHLQSPQLEFRGALVQQLRDITKKLDLCNGTLHSAVALLDLFMDSHRLRGDRLTHVALACLSLAAKSEEKYRHAPTLKVLSSICGVTLCGDMFKQLEWTVGQHARWRLLAPTPVTYAKLLAQYVVTDIDLTTRHPKFVRRFKRDGAKLLDAYLDLCLSDVRLKVVDSVDVGCACVACARADLGLIAWPPWLATMAHRKPVTVAPISRLLHRMMQIFKSRVNTDCEADQGYSSARTTPTTLPRTSTTTSVTPATSSECLVTRPTKPIDSIAVPRLPGPSYGVSTSYFQPVPTTAFSTAEHEVLDMEDSRAARVVPAYFRLPVAVDMSCQRVDHPVDYRYFRSSALIEDSLNTVQPSTSATMKHGPPAPSTAMKHGPPSPSDLERKRFRFAPATVTVPVPLPAPATHVRINIIKTRKLSAKPRYDRSTDMRSNGVRSHSHGAKYGN